MSTYRNIASSHPDRFTAYLSVGSNLGDRIANCENGLAQLAGDESVSIIARSSYYHTEPIGFADQPWFVNAVAAVSTVLPPTALLRRLKRIESICGRKEGGIRFGPRMLDLDILFYDGVEMNTPELIIPHPRLHERLFVLRPLSDIAPDLLHPGCGRTVVQMLSDLPVDSQQCRPVSDDWE